MKHQLSGFVDSAIVFLLLLVAGFTPILFFNQTTEFFNIPKLIFLIVATVLLYGLWVISWVLKGKVVISKTPLDFPLLLLLGVVLVSTFFSQNKFTAIYGNFPNIHGSTSAWVTYILLYFVTVSHLNKLANVKALLVVLSGSAAFVSLITLLSYFGLYLPLSFAKSVNFTPTGSTFSTIAFLLLMLPLPLLSLVVKNNYFAKPVALVLAILFSVTIVLISSMSGLIVLFVIYALTLFVAKSLHANKTMSLLAVPLAAVALVLLLSYMPLPGPLGSLAQLQRKFPREIQLPFAVSWKISASTFRDTPILGTGPASYLFNFTSYKPLEYNGLPFWNFSFDTAHNEFLQILGTMGILGFTALAALCLVVLRNSLKNTIYAAEETQTEDSSHVMLPALAIAGFVSVILFAIHATTLVSIVVTLLVLAAFMMSHRSIREKVLEFSSGLRAATADNRQFDLMPVVVFILYVIAAVPVVTRLSYAVAADYNHRRALSQANKNGTLTYKYLQSAEKLNPYVDLYRVDMAQTNFALANAIAAKARSGQGSPSAALSQQDINTIQTLLSQAINEGRAAIALSPRSARNWEVLASIYRNITGVAQNSLTFSLDGYGRAIQRDPLNPALRVNVGGIYYGAKNYDLAIRFFSDAANLKPDYANAYFNLAIALRDKGDLKNAKLVAQRAVNLTKDNKGSQSYKAVTELLADINKRAAKETKTATEQKTPVTAEGQANSELQNPDLPDVKVSNLNNPPKVTPAPTVRPNPSAALPRVSPSAAPTVTP